MSWTHATILLALVGVGLPSGASAAPPSSLPDTSGRRVLLISVDGLGDDVLDRRDELGGDQRPDGAGGGRGGLQPLA